MKLPGFLDLALEEHIYIYAQWIRSGSESQNLEELNANVPPFMPPPPPPLELKSLSSQPFSQKNTPFKSFTHFSRSGNIFVHPRWIPASDSKPMFSKHTQPLKTIAETSDFLPCRRRTSLWLPNLGQGWQIRKVPGGNWGISCPVNFVFYKCSDNRRSSH